eukprot:766392-Hanusia_phi.AAC.2
MRRRSVSISKLSVTFLLHVLYFPPLRVSSSCYARCSSPPLPHIPRPSQREISPGERVALCNYAGFLCNVRVRTSADKEQV